MLAQDWISFQYSRQTPALSMTGVDPQMTAMGSTSRCILAAMSKDLS